MVFCFSRRIISRYKVTLRKLKCDNIESNWWSHSNEKPKKRTTYYTHSYIWEHVQLHFIIVIIIMWCFCVAFFRLALPSPFDHYHFKWLQFHFYWALWYSKKRYIHYYDDMLLTLGLKTNGKTATNQRKKKGTTENHPIYFGWKRKWDRKISFMNNWYGAHAHALLLAFRTNSFFYFFPSDT